MSSLCLVFRPCSALSEGGCAVWRLAGRRSREGMGGALRQLYALKSRKIGRCFGRIGSQGGPASLHARGALVRPKRLPTSLGATDQGALVLAQELPLQDPAGLLRHGQRPQPDTKRFRGLHVRVGSVSGAKPRSRTMIAMRKTMN